MPEAWLFSSTICQKSSIQETFEESEYCFQNRFQRKYLLSACLYSEVTWRQPLLCFILFLLNQIPRLWIEGYPFLPAPNTKICWRNFQTKLQCLLLSIQIDKQPLEDSLQPCSMLMNY